MSFLSVPNIEIVGLSATVPRNSKDNLSDPLVADGEKILKNTGISTRHLADENTCASDMCVDAARRLMIDLNWDASEVDVLVFVTQTPDHILPSTAPLIQERLGLSKETYVIEISKGCSGYIYGLSVISSLMQGGFFKKGLLLAGDTISRTCSPEDKSTYPLFGDAGTATAFVYEAKLPGMHFHFGTDGGGKNAIIIEDGGFRNPYGADSASRKKHDEGISRANCELTLEGMDVFSFGISTAPKSVRALIERFEINQDDVDAFVFHQANLFMNEKIRKKLKIDESKVPYSLGKYANTSSATIPLTLVSEWSEKLKKPQTIVGCGFGVGLSWGSVQFKTRSVVVSTIEKI